MPPPIASTKSGAKPLISIRQTHHIGPVATSPVLRDHSAPRMAALASVVIQIEGASIRRLSGTFGSAHERARLASAGAPETRRQMLWFDESLGQFLDVPNGPDRSFDSGVVKCPQCEEADPFGGFSMLNQGVSLREGITGGNTSASAIRSPLTRPR